MFLQFFKALGDETRLRIVALLGGATPQRRRSGGGAGPLNRPSHHLARLRGRGW